MANKLLPLPLAFAAICHDACLWFASYGPVHSLSLEIAAIIAVIGLQANLLGSVLLALEARGYLGRASSRLATAVPVMAIVGGLSAALMLAAVIFGLSLEDPN
ncbi:hypothetical protein PUNSTDRAFT_128899 [Punctularia strigosozonata HHB-11173 SS5]|uniref:uncharacterized protein n=1 Tax=Punctularia strigosozonata (strain HHB-11173) TaxID=741275 RepID=UPI00044185B8|nr:uncharacterized protein PUNSTDRAFT_128899 [Punctularia strigosozonata HHB-11173 SS5]EIN13209.1 hypothetical protein PUNSTDRAFT_128899 [Punctularia strigosozonata HHB-11173 SS5]